MPGPAFASGSATSESAAARLETRLKHAHGILRGATTARRSHRERAVIKAAREYARLNTNEAGALSGALMNLINAAKALEES